MLIGSAPRHANLGQVRHIKKMVREALGLSDDVTVTVTELACLEEDCAPVETVIGLLRPDAPQLQAKLHKSIDAVNAADVARVCATWGIDPGSPVPAPMLKED